MNALYSVAHHRQNRRTVISLFRLILPENRDNSQRLLLLDQARQIVAQELAQHFIDHRGVVGAHDEMAELPLDGAERAFHVTPLVVVRHVFFLVKLEVMKCTLESAADLARRVCLESYEGEGFKEGVRKLHEHEE